MKKEKKFWLHKAPFKFLRRFRWYRKTHNTIWVKTVLFGWVTIKTYNYYIRYQLDPIALFYEDKRGFIRDYYYEENGN